MPIAQHKPLATPIVKNNLPKVEPKDYKSVVVDDKQVPLQSLIAFVAGAPWTVNYYSQVLSEHNDLRDFDPGQVNIYQQYTKIEALEIRVTTPISSTQDTENTLVTVTGVGLIYPFLTPNVGDVFIAGAGNGREGLYRISNVERKTFNRDSVFSVDYEMICFTDKDETIIQQLESKVTNTLHFSKERLLEGGVPVLQTDENNMYNDLVYEYKTICQEYFKTFFNKETSTLIIPGQKARVYDGFLVKYLLKIVDTFDAMEIRNIKNLTTEGDAFLEQSQFWTILEQRDYDALAYCNRYMGLVNTLSFASNPMYQGIRYSRVQYIVYPTQGDQSVFSDPLAPQLKNQVDPLTNQPVLGTIGVTPLETLKMTAMEDLVEASTSGGSLADILKGQYQEQNQTISLIYPVLKDKSYVLSDNFYSCSDKQSLIEVLTTDYIKGKALNIKYLHSLVGGRRRWGRLEQFYYTPIILTLIKALQKGLY